jgi:Domain of unknown function (DUF1707)
MTTTPRRFPDGRLRVSDAERDRALAELSDHYQAGRLSTEEFDDRSGQALQARTGAELATLFADLPEDPTPGIDPSAASRWPDQAVLDRVSPGHLAWAAGRIAAPAIRIALAVAILAAVFGGLSIGHVIGHELAGLIAPLILVLLVLRRVTRGRH